LVESDWQNTGDALATLDTDTGIEWLDLTQTDGMSINQAETSTVSGGTFEGWIFPTSAEVTQMIVNAFPSQASKAQAGVDFVITNTTIDNEADAFRALFGRTNYNTGYFHTLGILKGEASQTGDVIYSGSDDKRNSEFVRISLNKYISNLYSYKNTTFGVYLVSDGGTTLSSQMDPSINANNVNAPAADVSAPALLGLMGLGLFGFAARRRSSTTLNK
jgi:MYXO-CTERM domain-containing protein